MDYKFKIAGIPTVLDLSYTAKRSIADNGLNADLVRHTVMDAHRWLALQAPGSVIAISDSMLGYTAVCGISEFDASAETPELQVTVVTVIPETGANLYLKRNVKALYEVNNKEEIG
jgi:hypothetical protein